MIDVAEIIREAAVLPDRRMPWEWAGGIMADKSDAAVNFGNTTGFKGVYDIDNVPWIKAFLAACANPYVREASMLGPPQESGKTKGVETFLGYRICTDPANMAFNITTNVKAERWSETRWEPMLDSTPAIKEKFSRNKNHKKRTQIIFRDGTFLIIQGAETEGNRASDSIEVQVNDECNLWQAPWLKEMHDRTLAYPDTCKKINTGVGGKINSEWHQRFLAGNQGEWSHLCPECSKPFAYVFNSEHPKCNIRFDVNAAIVHADGRLELREFAKTIVVNCPECAHKMTYHRDRLRRLNLAGLYVDRNPDHDPSIASFHVNSFAIGRQPWENILEPWVRLHMRGGVFAPEVLREFINKPLAEFWDEKPFAVSTELKLAGWTRAEVMKPGSWSEELFRIMIVDNQRGKRGDTEHRWFAGIAFSATGRIRVFDAGRIEEWAAVKKKQIDLGVPDPTEQKPGPWVIVDRRYDPTTVDEMCARYKWYGSMGSQADEFIHPPWSPFAGTRQLFSEMRMMDIGFGEANAGRTFATFFHWSSQKIQDKLAKLRNEGKIEFAADSATWCPELPTHMNSHRQVMMPDKRGNETRTWVKIGDTPDHLYDIVSQAVVIGYMAGIYRDDESTK